MASSSLTVKCDRGEIRKYGGTRLGVKCMQYRYKQMEIKQFLETHPYLEVEDFKSMKLYTRFNKS